MSEIYGGSSLLCFKRLFNNRALVHSDILIASLMCCEAPLQEIEFEVLPK